MATFKKDPRTGYIWCQPAWWNKLDLSLRQTTLSSGRGGGGKSVWMALYCLLEAVRKPQIILCCREIKQSTDESSYRIASNWIDHPSAPWKPNFFKKQRGKIFCANGSEINFRGLSSSHGTAESLKSFEGADLCWVDESQTLTDESLDLLLPTIRKPGSRLFFTYNPGTPGDPVERLRVRGETDPNAQHLHLGYQDNPFFKDSELEKERLYDLETNPELYAHKWEGRYKSASPHAIIPIEELMSCQRDWTPEQLKEARADHVDSGYDIAVSQDGDFNAYARRCGGVVERLEMWPGGRMADSLAKIEEWNDPPAYSLFFDTGGIGHGFVELAEESEIPSDLEPVNFGSKVAGEDIEFQDGVLNGDYFARRNAQLYWALRLRVKNTMRYLGGEPIHLSACLLLPETLNKEMIDRLATQASIAEYDRNSSGKIEVKKSPKGTPSPDIFDALALAFAYDSEEGLLSTILEADLPEAGEFL